MKNKNAPAAANEKRRIVFRLFGEKTLLAAFAGLSLFVGIYSAFVGSEANVSASDVAAPLTIEKTTADVDSPDAAAANVATVVAKALAFKATLTTTQQATLEKTYTPALARRWSNLPCGANCRNGIQFSTLSSTQLAAALEVIQAAAGTAASEGADEFNQIRLADAFLGANGGGSGYSAGIYFISFLNTPTTTGPWMLQFGGHHYAANIGFNNGRFISATPWFMGVEPTTFTLSGTTYAPLEQERAALRNMLASLTTAQLTTARLTQTFSDVTLSPGESNGGNGTFPTTRVGIQVGTLSDAQKLLVLEAIKPYVRDVDDTVAANLLAIYQNELNNTYIAYTGTAGTSGNPSSFLTSNTNYVRIDGTSVWIEFICQNGAVFPQQIHYHTIWRDRLRDYGADLSLTTPLDGTKTRFDFDADGKADVSVFRPSAATWYLQQSTAGFSGTQFGLSTDKLTPADYDGDGKTDIAVFRDGIWYLQRSTAGFTGISFGTPEDIPVPADYDADGKADLAVFRPSTGIWYIQQSTSGFTGVQFGLSGDKPVPADYDADGKADIAVNRSGTWYLQRSTAGFTGFQFGLAADKLVPADYDGDGKADAAVFRDGVWYLQQSTNGFTGIAYGLASDVPAPADYDGDGKTDLAVFRDGIWYLNRSTAGLTSVAFGITGDTALPNVYVR